MAVGMIMRCELCGKSYDKGKTSHWAECDGGEEIRLAAEARARFCAMSTDEQLDYLYDTLQELADRIEMESRRTGMIG
jgi:hypothetical protein